MKRSRQAAKLTQRALAKKIHVSQNVVSGIETGALRSSTAVLPICDVLKIPPPAVLFEDEIEERWVEAGRKLRALEPRAFQGMLEAAERITKSFERSPTEH